MTDFKVGDIAEVRDNGPILKAGEQFRVMEVLGQRIRIDRPGASNVFSALIFRKVGGDAAREPVAAVNSLEALIDQGLKSPVKSVARAAERARDAVQRSSRSNARSAARLHYMPRSQSWSASCERPRPSSGTSQRRTRSSLPPGPQPVSPRCGPGVCPRASTCLPRVDTCHVRRSRPTRRLTHEA